MNRYSQKNRKQASLLKSTNRSLLINLPAMFMVSVGLAMPGMEADKQLPQVEPTNPGNLNVAPSNPSGTSTSPLNPRPSIFSEPPYNRSRQTSPTESNTAPTLEPTPEEVTPITPGNEPPSTLPTMEPTPGSGVTPTAPNDQLAPSTPTTTPEPGSTLQPPLPEEQQAPSATVMPVDGKIDIKLINATKAAVTYQVVGDTDQRTLTGDADVTLQSITTPVTVTLVRDDGGLLKVSPQATSAGLLEVTLDETTSLDESDSTMRVQQTGIVLLN